MIKTVTWKISAINRKETLKYLGYGKNDADGQAAALLDECEREVLPALAFKACYGIFDMSVDGDSIDLGFVAVKSRSLARNLSGCKRAIVFACTAGVGIDRLIAKYARISQARAAVIQAMGSACAEDFCDFLQASFVEEYGANASRFSCGFGDLPLAMQADIFTALNVTKNIGVTLSDDFFMTPTKSVTAIIGIK